MHSFVRLLLRDVVDSDRMMKAYFRKAVARRHKESSPCGFRDI